MHRVGAGETLANRQDYGVTATSIVAPIIWIGGGRGRRPPADSRGAAQADPASRCPEVDQEDDHRGFTAQEHCEEDHYGVRPPGPQGSCEDRPGGTQFRELAYTYRNATAPSRSRL